MKREYLPLVAVFCGTTNNFFLNYRLQVGSQSSGNVFSHLRQPNNTVLTLVVCCDGTINWSSRRHSMNVTQDLGCFVMLPRLLTCNQTGLEDFVFLTAPSANSFQAAGLFLQAFFSFPFLELFDFFCNPFSVLLFFLITNFLIPYKFLVVCSIMNLWCRTFSSIESGLERDSDSVMPSERKTSKRLWRVNSFQ